MNDWYTHLLLQTFLKFVDVIFYLLGGKKIFGIEVKHLSWVTHCLTVVTYISLYLATELKILWCQNRKSY